MFAEITQNMIMAAAISDKGVTEREKESLLDFITGTKKSSEVNKIVKYRDAADRLGVSIPTIKRLVKEGRLTPILGSGNRAIGVTLSSMNTYS